MLMMELSVRDVYLTLTERSLQCRGRPIVDYSDTDIRLIDR